MTAVPGTADSDSEREAEMKLGDVLRKEREKAGLSSDQMAAKLNLPAGDYQALEAGGNDNFENAAILVANFAKALNQPVSSLYYPCGIPFQELDDYAVRVVR